MAVFNFIFFTLLLGDLVWCWKLHLRLQRLPWRRAGNVCLAAFTALQVAGLFWLFFARHFDLPDSWSGKPLIASIYLWHCLVLLPLIVLWLVAKVVAGILWTGRALIRLAQPKAEPVVEKSSADAVTRRDFVAAAVCAAPAVVALGVTGLAAQEWSRFRIQRMTVPIPNLPAALDGLTIAHVSDLHVGIFTRGAVLDEIVSATNALQPDLVMLPGDLINYSLGDLPVALSVVQRLQASHGVFMCEGNHDLFENPWEFRRQTVDAGVRLLVNDTALISVHGIEIQVMGLRWGAEGGDPRSPGSRSDGAIAGSMKGLMAQRRPSAFPILLAHHPHAFDYAEGIPLTLSGHTHGGQLMLTKHIGCGPAMFRYWSGLYQKDGRTLVVSNGVGNWFPLRVQAPAEIVHITLCSV